LGAVFFLFLAIFGNLARKKKTEATEGTNGFFWEKLAQVAKL
jgi:hypothetical protein